MWSDDGVHRVCRAGRIAVDDELFAYGEWDSIWTRSSPVNLRVLTLTFKANEGKDAATRGTLGLRS